MKTMITHTHTMKEALVMNKGHILALLILAASFAVAQPANEEKVDTTMISLIKKEAMENSRAMEMLSWLTDVNGPRLTGSPGHLKAAEWVRSKLDSFGLEGARLDAWGPFGKGWTLKHYSANITGPAPFPLLSYPRAWSQGADELEGEVIYFSPATDSALQTFKGKLKGKFLMVSDPRVLEPQFKPRATRTTEQELLDLANADAPRRRRRSSTGGGGASSRAESMLLYESMEMARKEGALALLTASRGDGGVVFVQSANVYSHPDTPAARRVRIYQNNAPKGLPQIAIASEHYNRLHRMIEKGVKPKMELDFEVEFVDADSSYNVIAEIPGTDLKDEVVMVGAHLDSWHGGTGATDDGTGVISMLEVMRVLKAVGVQPRRTIRIGLWSGEEHGLLGSEAYVKKYMGVKETKDSVDTITLTDAGKKLSVYFNNDNGTGKVRGIYMQGNEKVRSIFRAWLKPYASMGATTLTLSNTGSTDHISFDGIGIPAFQFIQDDIEYFALTWHSTMDVYDRVIEDDLKQTVAIMAGFVYNAAMRDEMLPRK